MEASAMPRWSWASWLPLVIWAVLPGCAVSRGQESVGNYADDAAITAAIKAKFADSSAVDATAITVETLHGEVLLSGFALSRSYPLSLVLLGAVGFCFVIQNAPANSLIQALVPDHLRGRVMAIYVALLLGLMRVGGLLAGFLAHALSAPVALAGLAAASLLGSLAVSSRFPELRRME
mgnify:CR=1 FL=1